MDKIHVIIGVTGASGSILAKKAIEHLAGISRLSVVATENAKKVFAYELGKDFDGFVKNVSLDGHVAVYDNNDMSAPIASGSNRADSMIILPCSMATVAKIANGIGDTLLTRAADVALKERRRLVIAPRECPVSEIHLRNMLMLTRAGAIIAPPVPQFYGRAASLDDAYGAIVGRILLAAGIDNDLYTKWRDG